METEPRLTRERSGNTWVYKLDGKKVRVSSRDYTAGLVTKKDSQWELIHLSTSSVLAKDKRNDFARAGQSTLFVILR